MAEKQSKSVLKMQTNIGKTVAAIILTSLLIEAGATMFHGTIVSVAANPIDRISVSVPSIDIGYPPYPPRKYENSSIELQIYVRLFNDAPKLKSIYYSLDEMPLVYLDNFTITNLNDIGSDQLDFTAYKAEVILENLSEGNHTVKAYANDMSISRNFTVNSHFQETIVRILSPTNQTYAYTVPLIFTVNGEIKEAHYYMYKGYEAVYEKFLNGNITLANLSDGNYTMHLYVTTEKGEATTSTYFTMSNGNFLENPLVAVGITALAAFTIVLGVLVYFKKRRR